MILLIHSSADAEDRTALEKYAKETFREMEEAADRGLIIDGRTVRITWSVGVVSVKIM